MGRPRRTDLAVVPDLEHELDELYGLPLGEFTAARNELAKRLKKAGQAREAESVGGLAKPSISAWAVNQLSRRDADRVRELAQAGEELVAAQKAALAGKGADRFDAASRRQREAVRALLPEAIGALEEAGHRPSDAVKERVASCLRAASVDPEGRRLLEHGRFQEDFESAGIGLLAGIAPAPAKRKPKRADEARLREAREQLEAVRKEERRAAEAAAEAEREAEQAATRAQELAKEAERAREAAEKAEQALARLEQ